MSRIGNLSSRIFVGGLDVIVDENDLEKAFASFGEIINVMVMRDRETGKSRGFAFISFKDSMSSEDAIKRMHGVEIRGRCVTVRHAERERHLEDKNQNNRGGGYARGRGGIIRNTRPSSDFNERRFPVSKTVYVAEEEQDYTRSASYRQRRSPSPRDRAYARNDSRPDYRDRSPHYGDDAYRSRNETSSHGEQYYFKGSQSSYGRLSPTKELSAYIHSRGRAYSPMRSLNKNVTTDSSDYQRGGAGDRDAFRTYGRRSSPEQEKGSRSYYDRPARDYADDRRRSPDQSKPGGSYVRTSSTSGSHSGYQTRDVSNYRETRRDFTETRKPAVERRSPQRGGSFKGSQATGESSWGRNGRQRSPPQSSYSGWSNENGRTGRDQRGGREGDTYQRGGRSDSSRYTKDDYTSASRASQDWKSREGNVYQDRGRDQSWKSAPASRSFGAKRDIQRTDARSGGTDYRRNQYRTDERDRNKSAGAYRNSSPPRRQTESVSTHYGATRRY